MAAKARNEELYKLLLFAVTQLEWLARDDPNHVQFSAACVTFFGCLQHFPPEDVYDTLSCRTFLRVARVFVFFTGRKWNRRFDRTCLQSVRAFVQLQPILCIYPSSCICYTRTQHSPFEHGTLHWQHHTYIARPSEHQTTQVETSPANTACVLRIGTTLVLQPDELSPVCGIAVDLHK